jgi:hypothetical protein
MTRQDHLDRLGHQDLPQRIVMQMKGHRGLQGRQDLRDMT